MDGLQTLKRLVQAASDRILIMPCGGINSDNVADIVKTTLAQEVHSSAGTSGNGDLSQGNNGSSGTQFGSFEEKVAKLVSRLTDLSCEPRLG
jgi:copper homeostasis protein CutC